MSRRDDRDRSRTRRRRDRSPSPQARKARRREHNDNQVSEGMDWNNLVSWQHNSGYNSGKNFPVMPGNYQSIPNPTQQFHHSGQLHDAGSSRAHAGEVHDARDATTGHSLASYTITWIPCSLASSTSESLAYTIGWTPGDGMLDVNQLYNFSLPMTVANTPHNNLRDMSGMDIRDVRLVQVIHGGITNWLLRPFAHGRFVTWEGFRTRTRRGLTLEYLFQTTTTITVDQPTYLGKGPCQLTGAQPGRLQSADQGS